MMSQEEYLQTYGGRCPKCQSINMDMINLEKSGPFLFKDMECNDCGCRWLETYELKGFRAFEPEYSTVW